VINLCFRLLKVPTPNSILYITCRAETAQERRRLGRALWQRGCENSESGDRGAQCGLRRLAIGNLKPADKLVAEDRRNPSTEEGGDAKVRRMIFVSDEIVCTCKFGGGDFCITKKNWGRCPLVGNYQKPRFKGQTRECIVADWEYQERMGSERDVSRLVFASAFYDGTCKLCVDTL
jgi:hypothetical protein